MACFRLPWAKSLCSSYSLASATVTGRASVIGRAFSNTPAASSDATELDSSRFQRFALIARADLYYSYNPSRATATGSTFSAAPTASFDATELDTSRLRRVARVDHEKSLRASYNLERASSAAPVTSFGATELDPIRTVIDFCKSWLVFRQCGSAIIRQRSIDSTGLERDTKAIGEVRTNLIERAANFHNMSVTSMTFGGDFKAAIEAKQEAAQESERAKFVGEKAEQDKRRAIIKAQAVAANPRVMSTTSLIFGREFKAAVEAKQLAAHEAEKAKFVVEKAEQDKGCAIVRPQYYFGSGKQSSGMASNAVA